MISPDGHDFETRGEEQIPIAAWTAPPLTVAAGGIKITLKRVDFVCDAAFVSIQRFI
jgi:hypothetical protein